ncbi:MAG: PEP-CTERM sorting domain-containing protein [Akkermansiaceae bacterium]
MEKLVSALAIFTFSTVATQAAITLVDSGFNQQSNTITYSNIFFSGVSVLPGDMLVLTHSNNKRNNGNNSISASAGAESFTAIAAGDSGGQAGAWLFYASIEATGTLDIVFNTSNASNNGTKASGYYVLRPEAGETIVLADSDTAAAAIGINLGLSFNSTAIGGFGVMAAAVSTDEITGTPTGWTQDTASNSSRRVLWSDEVVNDLNPSVTIDANDSDAAVGAVFIIVPEPSTGLLGALAGVFFLSRRKRSVTRSTSSH